MRVVTVVRRKGLLLLGELYDEKGPVPLCGPGVVGAPLTFASSATLLQKRQELR